MHPKEINISDYLYDLPSEKIAQHPVKQRDESQLIIASDIIKKDIFKNIDIYLPNDSFIIFNDTRVIHARLEFKKTTGARIEIFLLNPISPTAEIEQSFAVKGKTTWNSFVGNLKKWKGDSLESEINIGGKIITIKANYIKPIGNSHHIEFSWDNEDFNFGEIIESLGKIPLPPYMTRKSEAEDSERYQTIYARQQGSVAAPTAGLHFTPSVIQSLEKKGIETDFVTLDVGAGTFKPVSAETMESHEMHTEKIYVKLELIQKLKELKTRKKIIAVGTTTTRTLESLYWFANKISRDPNANFHINQWDPYEPENNILSVFDSLEIIENYMISKQISILQGQTQLIIAPGYKFKIVDILITNFHQPGSTLLLLVAAFYGKKWKEVYEYALNNNFRFLSYGDSCVFYLNKNAD